MHSMPQKRTCAAAAAMLRHLPVRLALHELEGRLIRLGPLG